MYSGTGGYSSTFLSPANMGNLPTSQTVGGVAGLNSRQNQNPIQISKVMIQSPDKKPIVIQKKKIVRWGGGDKSGPQGANLNGSQ